MEMITSADDFEKKKSRDPIDLRCIQCGQPFTRPKNAVQVVLKGNMRRNLNFCGSKCANDAQRTGVAKYPCALCGKLVERHPSEVRKVARVFCSSSCSASYTFRSTTNTGRRRGQAEAMLEKLLRDTKPGIAITTNERGVIPVGEIDLYLPEFQIAIEINGPTHYRPIFGHDKLAVIQARDAAKKAWTDYLGIRLIVIDVNVIRPRAYREFIPAFFDEHIKPLIT